MVVLHLQRPVLKFLRCNALFVTLREGDFVKQPISATRVGNMLGSVREKNAPHQRMGLALWEQQGFIVHRAIQHMQHVNRFDPYPIENEVVAMHAAADSVVFMAGDKLKPLRHVGKPFATLPQFPHKANRPYGVGGGDYVAYAFKIGLGLIGNNNDH